jgi:hypothetical protein
LVSLGKNEATARLPDGTRVSGSPVVPIVLLLVGVFFVVVDRRRAADLSVTGLVLRSRNAARD